MVGQHWRYHLATQLFSDLRKFETKFKIWKTLNFAGDEQTQKPREETQSQARPFGESKQPQTGHKPEKEN